MALRFWMALALLTANASVWAENCGVTDAIAERERLDYVLKNLERQLPSEGADMELTPITALPAIERPLVRLASQGIRSRIAVELSGHACGAERETKATVWFKVRAMKEAWVYGRNAKSDTSLVDAEPRRAMVDMAALQVQAKDLPEHLDGFWLRQSVNAGMPILNRHLQAEPLVQRSGPVTVLVYGPGLMLRVQGKAMSPGALGDTVPVLVNGAESSLLAVVAGKGEVHVER